MFELIARISLAALALLSALLLKQPEIQLTSEVGLFFCGYSAVLWLLEVRKMRNAGISGIAAIADCACIALLLSRSSLLDQYGFVVLAPVLWAVSQHDADPLNMAPLAAGCVMVGSVLFGGPGFNTPMLFHTLGVLLVGMLAQKSKVIIREKPLVVERLVTAPAAATGPEDTEVREQFRALREHTTELEKRSRRDRYSALLHETSSASEAPSLETAAKAMLEICQAEGTAIYALNDVTQTLSLQGMAGQVPTTLANHSLELVSGLGEGQLKHRFDKEILAWRDGGDQVQVASLCIKHRGKIVGLLVLFQHGVKFLESVVERAEEALDTLTTLVIKQLETDEIQRRLREAEILYSVASAAAGAETPQTLAARVVRELGETLKLDQIGIYYLDGREAIQVVTRGNSFRLFELVRFAGGDGVPGWLQEGGSELILNDAYKDARLPEKEALKRRIGSYAVFPIKFGPVPFGFLTAGQGRVDGLDRGRIETLRVVSAELGQAIARLTDPEAATGGLMTPKEFRALIAQSPLGYLVYLDINKKEDLVNTYGQTAIDLAQRRLAAMLRQKLPAGGGLCRRDEGGCAAFLKGANEEFARAWADEVVGLVAASHFSTPDGRAKLPLLVRAKLAAFAPQMNQISASKAS